MTPSSKQRLIDVVERARRVEGYSYFDGQEEIIGFHMKHVDSEWQVKFKQPSEEQRDALCLNARLFLQNKDDISFRRLCELYDDPGISEAWKEEHRAIRSRLNAQLDEVASEGGTRTLTKRDVLKMFLYGGLSHRSESDQQYKMYKRWTASKELEKVLHYQFHDVLLSVAVAIINLGRASRDELARQGTAVPA